MSNNRKSSVEWLIEQFENKGYIGLQDELLAKAMHKEEIVEAHAVGRIKQCAGILTDGYEYYNEEFKN